jgi:hypothetical protein
LSEETLRTQQSIRLRVGVDLNRDTDYVKPTGDVSILLFCAYAVPQMSRYEQQDEAISLCYSTLAANNITGRLRIAREGFNSTLTGSSKTVRIFTSALRGYAPHIFDKIDFKCVDGLPDNQALKVGSPHASILSKC